MGKMVIFIIIACALIVVWSACVMAARVDEKLREIMDDKKEPEEKRGRYDETKNMQTVWNADGSNVLQDKYKC